MDQAVKHTAGPYFSEPAMSSDTANVRYITSDIGILASVRWRKEQTLHEAIATASLFAAAPDLIDNERKNLATLQITRMRLREYGKATAELDEAIRQTEQVIAKAEKAR